MGYISWTEERKATLVSLRSKGLYIEQIAERMGLSPNSIKAAVSKFDIPLKNFTPPGIKNTKWTPERVNVLEKLWPTYSAQKIANRLGHGISRNAVIGKAHRLGLKLEKPKKPKAGIAHSHPRKSLQEPTLKSYKPDDHTDAPVEITLERPKIMCWQDNIRLIDASASQCKWMIDSEHVCGSPVRKSSSWCAEHYKSVFQPPRPRNSNPVRP